MKTKFGSIVINGSGRLGGHSMGSGGRGSYLCNHSVKKKTASPAQIANRLRVNQINRHWNSLSGFQKKSFDNAVSLWVDSDMFGDVQLLTGKQLHFKFNMFNLLAGQNMITSPPGKIKLPYVKIEAIQKISFNNRIRFLGNTTPYTGYKTLIYASKIMKQSVAVNDSDYRYLGIGLLNTPAVNDGGLFYSKYGAYTDNSNFKIAYRIVSPSGQASILFGGKLTGTI